MLVETKISKVKAIVILIDLDLKFSITMEDKGYTRGIWVAWKSDLVKVIVKKEEETQTIISSIILRGKPMSFRVSLTKPQPSLS